MVRFGCLVAALLLATPVLAAEDVDEHAGHHPPAAAEDGSRQSDHKVSSATHLQKNMQTMSDLMARIRETTDAAEKKRLLGAHMLAMQEQIKSIRAVSAKAGGHEHEGDGKGEGKGDAGKPEGAKGAEGKPGGMMGGGMMMKKMHKQMEQRMDALEQLLEQLIEHEAAEEGVKGE